MNSSKNTHYSRELAMQAIAAARARGERIIFTSGAFDLLHVGHAQYLDYAKKLGGFLVVGVNTDQSVRSYKDPRRPISDERSRVELVASLRSVDAAFLFEETNNAKNIELIKPDVYVKAGDYSKEKLSSAAAVEAYGGQVVLAPYIAGSSSSSIIDRVIDRYGAIAHGLSAQPPPAFAPAVFLDRDGTINEFVEYLSEPEKFRILPNAIEGVKALQARGFRIIVTTNQPGIGLGYFTKEDLFRVNLVMLKAIDAAGVKVDKIYFCPDSYSVESHYRKPGIGMIERAKAELNLDVEHSYVVGDMTIDVEFARNAGCRSVLVRTGKGGTDGRYKSPPTFVANDLFDAAKLILEDYEQRTK